MKLTWEVEIIGDANELCTLLEIFKDSDPQIIRAGDKYYIRASKFEQEEKARIVDSLAQKYLDQINGGAILLLDFRSSLTTGNIRRRAANGGFARYMIAGTGVLELRGYAPTIQISNSGGTAAVSRPGESLPRWIDKALTDQRVADILSVRNKRHLNWGELYWLFETVEKNFGISKEKMAVKGWATITNLELFKWTANTANAATDDGKQARHAARNRQPPPNPMSLDEARRLIDRVVQNFLDS